MSTKKIPTLAEGMFQLEALKILDNPDLSGSEKELIIQTLELAERLGLTIWQLPDVPRYYVSDGQQLWVILDHDEYSRHPMNTVKGFFKFMLSYRSW